MEGGVRYVKSLNPGTSLNHRGHDLCDTRIRAAVVGFGVFRSGPQTEGERFLASRAHERHFVLEPILLAKQGNNLRLQFVRKLGNAVRFQAHVDSSGKHGTLLENVERAIQVTTLVYCS